MSFIKSLASKCHACIIAIILLLSEIMPTYSRCVLKGLVCIIIVTPLNCQPFFYTECTKLNIRLSYNVKLVSNAKYIFLYVFVFYKVYDFLI